MYLRKIPVLRLNFPRHSAREIFRLSTGIFRKYPSQTWYICIQLVKRSELLKATKNIPKIPDLKGIGISQDLTKNRSKIAYLARQAVKQKQIKSTSVRDGKIFISDNRKIITCEDELNAILNTGCVNQDGTFNINLSLPPPQSHGMFAVRPPSPALLSQQGIPLELPQISCQPHMLNQFMPNMFGSQLM